MAVASTTDADRLAARLEEAWARGVPIPPLTETEPGLDPEGAYAVQMAWTARREREGETVLGRKIGLTSEAIQAQMGVSEPDYGSLWGSRFFPAEGGRADVPIGPFLQPRAEGEIAFLLGRDLGEGGQEVTPEQVMEATEALAVSVEIIDSRIEDWRIKLPDTIADNASYGGFTVGTWSASFRELDLPAVEMVIRRGGEPVIEGTGAASLGHPARSVAWLANTLARYGVPLRAGDVVLSGSLGPAIPVAAGDELVVEMTDQAPLTIRFAGG